jgi:chlorobactene glucosyltransferase
MEYNEIILLFVCVMGLVALVNVLSFRSLRRVHPPGHAPLVSVLLPARNEERNIGLVLSTLADQDYPNYEVIVLNDGSEDATGRIAEQWMESNRRFRLIRGKPLPEGWVGKSFACHQLSEEAKGDFLLFIDADTIHSRHCISSAVAELSRSGAGLLTVIPYQIMDTFWEKAVLPLLHFTTFCFLPMPLVRLARHPKFAMANGQFMLFRRDAYRAAGGHEAVRTALVEDVWLSRLVKKSGNALAIRDGAGSVSCRMYRSFREIWEGFSKNLFAGFGYSVPMLTAMMAFNAMTSILPFVALLGWLLRAGSVAPPWLSMVVAQAAIILAIRLVLALRFRLDLWSSFVHPIAMTVLIGIAANSCRWVLTGGGARWKGRAYDFRKHVTVP